MDCSLCRVIQQKDGHIRTPSEQRMIRNIRNVWAPRKNRKSNFWCSNQSVSSSCSSSSSNPSPSPSRAPPPPRPPPWTNKLRLGVQPRAKMRSPRAASTPPPLGSLLHSPSSTSWHSPVSQALSSAVAAQTCHTSGEGFEGSGMGPNVAGNNGIAQQWQPLEANMATLMRTHCTSHKCHQPSPAAQQLQRLLFSKTKAVSLHTAADCGAWGAALLLLLVAALLPPLCNSTRGMLLLLHPARCSRICAQHRARRCPLTALLGRVEVWRLGHGV